MNATGMHKDEFEGAVAKLLRIHLRDRMLPDAEIHSFVDRYWQSKNLKDSVDFVEFANEYSHLMKEQGVLSESGKLHACAMKHKVSVAYAANIKSCFEAYQDDCLKVDFEGFVSVMYRILKAQPGTEFPESRSARFWKELDVLRAGKVDFEHFFAWWLLNFYIGDEEEDPDMPMFYRRVRCQRTFTPDPAPSSPETGCEKHSSSCTSQTECSTIKE
mmetsp:Transcript_32633/g.53707  ORF Transcript_32633/g.53707 Transcript_32633/m.53707 type:complete len:216 (+) Transcript_32633:33-680(+)